MSRPEDRARRTAPAAHTVLAQCLALWVVALALSLGYVSSAAAQALPTGWADQDVGVVGLPGNATYSNGTFTVQGAGADIWGTADSFNFVNLFLATDGQIVAHVASMQNTNTYAKAGVMIRETLTAGSADLILDMKPGGAVEFMARATPGGPTAFIAGGTGSWLKLARSKGVFTASVSTDGVAWTSIGGTSLAMGTNVSIGLAVCSHNTSVLNTSIFDNVTVTTDAPPAVSISSPTNGATFAAGATITLKATASDTDATGVSQVLFYANNRTTNALLGTATVRSVCSQSIYVCGSVRCSYVCVRYTVWYQFNWTNVPGGSYSITAVAVDTANQATTSSPVSITVTGGTTAPPPPDVVLYAADAAIHGASWALASDSTAAGQMKLATPDKGLSWTSAPQASPTDYFEVTFNANAGVPYAIWLRLEALGNSKYNDSIWVQFSDALASGAPVYQIGTTDGLLVNLATDGTGASLNGWGWQNGAYWLSQKPTVTFATSGMHTMRIQAREDGVALDQIVLSPATYLSTAPGSPTADTKIVPK